VRTGFGSTLFLPLALSALAVQPPFSASNSGPAEIGTAAAKHVIVHYEPGRFCGWPANNGAWSWGNELLVGFVYGFYQAQEHSHSIDRNKPQASVLARSLDGGETWKLEDPEAFVLDGGTPVASPGGIRFGDPNFAMRVGNHTLIGNRDPAGQFFVSYDRGRHWQGPFLFPSFGWKMTSRTDYLVEGAQSCLILLSAEYPGVQGGNYRDRAFAVRTVDGGKTFQRLGWLAGDSVDARSVMPSTVRLSATRLLTALRRKTGTGDAVRNWIDVYGSEDNGVSWSFVSTVVEGLPGNGNPPSMVRLRDSRLVVCYGDRTPPYSIKAKISLDDGRTWRGPVALRQDGRSFDIGYPRTLVRPDGKLVTIYYFTTHERPEMHIAATIWDPDAVR
jgi:hypothetical protein